MTFSRINDAVLHWDSAGTADSPAVVLLHSLGGDTRIWDDMLPALGARRRILRYDMRGHGLSELSAGPFGIADLADDLAALLDLIGVETCALVGISAGGMVAQSFSAGRPDRVSALVLCSTAVRIGTAESWAARIAAVERDGLPAMADGLLERWFTPGFRARRPDEWAGWRNMLTRTPPTGYTALCAAIGAADLAPHATSIRAPCLCVVGDADESTTPDLVRATAALIPNARSGIVEDAGHLPCLERPDRLAELILAHLDA